MNISTVDKKTLRVLTGDYLKNPDPIAWRAAADLYEEAGDGETAALWRHRARWFNVVLSAWLLRESDLYPREVSLWNDVVVRVGGQSMWRTAAVSVRRGEEAGTIHRLYYRRWHRFSKDGIRHIHRNIIWLLDFLQYR